MFISTTIMVQKLLYTKDEHSVNKNHDNSTKAEECANNKIKLIKNNFVYDRIQRNLS